MLVIVRSYPYCVLLARLDLPRTSNALMAAPLDGWTVILLGPFCELLLALPRPVVWERRWCCLLQLMTFPLHRL